jgi:FG-GAP-like repeat/Fibronectin type III domain
VFAAHFQTKQRPAILTTRLTAASRYNRCSSAAQMFQLKTINVWTGTALFLITASPARAADVTLAWDANSSPAIAGYKLYWGTASGVYTGNADVGTSTSYVVTGLDSDTRYYFTVRSYSSGGTMSAQATEISGMAPAIAAPKPPSSPTPTLPPTNKYRITSGDFDGDGRADVTIYRPEEGVWYILKSSTNFGSWEAYQWGISTDIPVAGDYDGDGRLDIAVWRPSTGVWWILTSRSKFTKYRTFEWGSTALGDVPVVGDYDGDRKADVAVWRRSTGEWWILTSSSGFKRHRTIPWGDSAQNDVPVPADYDGDGKTDVAVWSQTTWGIWRVLTSSSAFSQSITIDWGVLNDEPVPGDYDGDGKADVAAWRPDTGDWYILTSSSGYTSYYSVQWGTNQFNDIPLLGDFDGDRIADPAVYRPLDGSWWFLKSASQYDPDQYGRVWWGIGGSRDIPLGAALLNF